MELLKLTDIRKPLQIRISPNGQFDWFEHLCSRGDEFVDFDVFLPSKGMNLQREFVWTLEQKQELIWSILKERPIPKVSIIEYWSLENIKRLKIEVIDGKQRMGAYMDFCANKFPLKTGHYFDDLDKDCRMCIFRFYTGKDICTVFGDIIPDDDKIAWFE